MHEKPLVSVLIPTFRRPKELRKVLESVVAQTYENLEILVSNNDCENDETNDICQEFTARDKRVSCYVQPSNIGGVGNSIFLLRSAKGEFTLVMNDDDWLSDNFIELTLDILQRDPKCVMVQGGYILYTAESQSGSAFIMDDNVHDSRMERILATILTTVKTSMPPIHGLCRTGHLIQSMPSGEKTRYGEDWIMGVKIASLGNIRTIPGATYHKRWIHDTDYYADFFNALNVNRDNAVEQLFLQIADSIAYDSSYDDKLERLERMSIVTQLGVLREAIRGSTGGYIKGLIPCLRYLLRHPLALFKKKADVMLEIKKRGRKK